MVLIDGDDPAKPGLVSDSSGPSFPVEIWRLREARLAAFLRLIPEPLALGPLQLEDGTRVHGFVCRGGDYRDISSYGGWRGYLGRAKVD